jgi:hypothetical protein
VCSDKARDELGWVPTVEFEHGLRETVEWFCAKWGRPLTNGHDPARAFATNGNGTEPVDAAHARPAGGGNGAKAVGT